MDLWSLLSIVAPGLFPHPQRFTRVLPQADREGHRRRTLLATLRRRIRPLMLRRTKEQVATELPPKQEQVLEVTLQPAASARSTRPTCSASGRRCSGLVGDLDKNRFTIFRSLTLLRQLSLDPALVDDAVRRRAGRARSTLLVEQLDEVVQRGPPGPGVQPVHRLPAAGPRPARRGAGSATATWTAGPATGTARSTAFKAGGAPVFLISLKAGGFGLNLTEADYCFVLDPWWNPAVEAQAVDRTHRIGQDKTVMVYRLVAAGHHRGEGDGAEGPQAGAVRRR